MEHGLFRVFPKGAFTLPKKAPRGVWEGLGLAPEELWGWRAGLGGVGLPFCLYLGVAWGVLSGVIRSRMALVANPYIEGLRTPLLTTRLFMNLQVPGGSKNLHASFR